ncbi:polysaccharide export outer membrane protein [Filimonas zeae]|uniref:Polysaccharide biosynthesis protein n=1 Tax=Filimonas zeae TaxID=1737353 RepID=A0A917J0X3_9BACT|nr:polysaccharide biosynthesis/export family protein [Filimonas zeae]MDR6340492.1 polysaccharide export outer membrane protein [Filimonas zeae]GGH72997.1 polysaccharide biosynthesis protein [Filimonas zeae]
MTHLHKQKLPRFFPVVLILLLVVANGCVNTRKATYFAEQQDEILNVSNAAPATTITENDLLSITVSSLSNDASAIFNASNNAGMATLNQTENVLQPSGYLVNKDGDIKFPFLGKLKVAGMSEMQLEEMITKTLSDKKLLLDPIVTVRHLNFKVTVLGEVSHPSVLKIASEKISLLEALGLAGDLTIYAKRDNILLIREEKNTRIVQRINLNESSFLTSPYYYLKSNDIIYAEPNKAKLSSTGRTQQMLPIILGSLTFLAIIVDRFGR